MRSIKDKIVIGRFENKNIIPIDSTSLELCTKWRFKYDKDLVEGDESTYSEEEQEEHEEEEEQEEQEEQEEHEEEEEQEEHEEEEEQEEHEEGEEQEEHEEEEEEEQEIKNNYNTIINSIKSTSDDTIKLILSLSDKVKKYEKEIRDLKKDLKDTKENYNKTSKKLESIKKALF